jgi:hypothetical protein
MTNRSSLEQTKTNVNGKWVWSERGKEETGEALEAQESYFFEGETLSRHPPQVRPVNIVLFAMYPIVRDIYVSIVWDNIS